MLKAAAGVGGAIAMCAILLGSARSMARAPEARRAVSPADATRGVDAALWSIRDRMLARHTPEPALPEAPLAMRVVARDEKLEVVPFDGRGEPRPDAFASIRHFFRSRTDHSVDIDPRLVELLGVLGRHWPDRPLVLVSAYRDPTRLGRNKSYHLRGMAADVAVPGVRAFALYKAAVALGARGTGLYPSFVHVDVRDVPYRWTGR
jgi:uncharacterized protein YcbK (DUF882 family)